MAEEKAKNESLDGADGSHQEAAKKERNSGRLELTWSNKDRALLAHEDGAYEWVPKRDHRVAEVRLLREAGTVGEVHSEEERAKDNLLIRGDSLNALTALTRSPEFADEYAGKVKLAYLDPPFNTGQVFEQYDDGLEHSVWLTMMRDRLMQIKELLAPDGSVWVHLDDTEVGYCRVLMDEIFGRENFVATVIWQKVYSPKMDTTTFSVDHDYLLVYSLLPSWKPNPINASADSRNFGLEDEKGRRYRLRSLRKEGSNSRRSDRPTMWYPITAPDGSEVWPIRGDGSEGCWRWERERVERDYRTINWVRRDEGFSPYLRQYEAPDKGLPPQTIWLHSEVGHNHGAKEHIKQMFPTLEPFGTPKPERLLERIIHIGSNPGDIVLDSFAGSGTTAAVAQKMSRRWVTVEWERETIDRFTAPRLEKVISGEDPGGVTEQTTLQSLDNELPKGVSPEQAARFTSLLKKFADLVWAEQEESAQTDDHKRVIKAFLSNLRKAAKTRKQTETLWEGGGGFRVLDVAPSMYEDDGGVVVLADWATKSALAEAVAAQLGFEYEIDPPFCGRHCKVRLAVIDGHADEAAVRLLAKSLDKGDKLSLCATSLDPEAGALLAKLKRGSQARVVPQDILLAYRTPSAWRVSVAREETVEEGPENEAADESVSEETGE